MNIALSQQVSATYARNHFKEVMDTVREGTPQVIIHKSQPTIIVMRIDDLKKIEETNKPKKKARKFDLEKIQENNPFYKYAGCIDKVYGSEISTVELCKKWAEYVD